MKHITFKKKSLALVLILALLLPCFSFVTVAEDASALAPLAPQELPLPDLLAAMVADSGETFLQRAYDQEQGLNDVVLQSNDRTYVSYIFNDPVKFTDSQGTHDKDTTLISTTGGYQQKANDIQSFLPTRVTDGVTYSAQGYSLTFSPVAAQNVVVGPIQVTNNGYGENVALYPRVFGENTALQYTPYYSSLKEEIVLNAYTGQTEFSFLYETNGLSFSDTAEGLFLVNSQGQRIFTFPALVAYDTNGKLVECNHDIETVKPGEIYFFTVSVPSSFLAAEDTQYPVYVDPTVNFTTYASPPAIEDTTIYSGQTSPLSGNETGLWVGAYNNTGTEAIAIFSFPGIINKTYYKNLFNEQGRINRVSLLVSENFQNEDSSVVVEAKEITGAQLTMGTATYSSISNRISSEVLSSNTVCYQGGSNLEGTEILGDWYFFDITETMAKMFAPDYDSQIGPSGIALDPKTYTGGVRFASAGANNYRPVIRYEYSVEPILQTENPNIIDGGIYAVVNFNDDFAMDGTDLAMRMETPQPTNPAQHFQFIYQGSGKYLIKSVDWDSYLRAEGNRVLAEGIPGEDACDWYVFPSYEGSWYNYIANVEMPYKQVSTGGSTTEGTFLCLEGEGSGALWKLELIPKNEVESNNTKSAANTLTVANRAGGYTWVSGTLSSTGDADWYKITPERHGRLQINAYFPAGYNYNLTVYNSDNTVIPLGNVLQSPALPSCLIKVLNGSSTSPQLEDYYIKIDTNTSSVSTEAYQLSIGYSEAYRLLAANSSWVYPVTPERVNISSPVGYRVLKTGVDYHNGIDIPGNQDSATKTILSVCDGRIQMEDYHWSMGNYVRIISDDIDPFTGKHYVLRYMHLDSTFSGIVTDKEVEAGEPLGIMGNTGQSGDTHLHLDINDQELQSGLSPEDLVNPIDFFDTMVDFTGKVYVQNQ